MYKCIVCLSRQSKSNLKPMVEAIFDHGTLITKLLCRKWSVLPMLAVSTHFNKFTVYHK